ncbi:MAG: alpha/beta fold hydrolase [Acidobacteria bacterium]|nr:alpha/beta fold hydrolase [Acidobacteriota bacterium]
MSIADTRRDDSVAAMAERILRDNPGEFAVVGTSMGGYVALEILRQAPERVLALALVSTSARADTPEQVQARERQIHLVEQGQFDALVEATFPAIVATGHEGDQAMLATWRAMAASVGPEAFVRQQRAVINRRDLTALLPTITCPTAIIHGSGDRYLPAELAQESAKAIPQATLTLVPDAGHFVFYEQPEAVAVALTRLLDIATGKVSIASIGGAARR